jgi:DNA-binding NarL/FixJ family response regulator
MGTISLGRDADVACNAMARGRNNSAISPGHRAYNGNRNPRSDRLADMAIRVLIADNQALLRQGVKHALESAGHIEVVGEAATSDDAVDLAAALAPDVVVMETGLPDGGGVEAVRTIKQRCPNVRILVLSSEGDPEAFGKAAAAGAIGYVLKDISPENLINAIRAVYARRSILSPTIAQQIVRQLSLVDGSGNGTQDFVVRAGRRTMLRGPDIEVLTRIARGLSDKEIAAQLFLSESAIKTRLRHIYRKLGLKNRAQAAVFALENGLLMADSEIRKL